MNASGESRLCSLYFGKLFDGVEENHNFIRNVCQIALKLFLLLSELTLCNWEKIDINGCMATISMYYRRIVL